MANPPLSDAETVDHGRRGALTCMAWAGTGLVWTLAAGVPLTTGLVGGPAQAAAPAGLTFAQISDSHVGFDKPANPDALATLREAVAGIRTLPTRPAFILHTGDISHLSHDDQFDAADQVLKELGLPIFFVPGEHDVLDDGGGAAYLARYGKGPQGAARGAGWYSFDQAGIHFVALVNVVNLKAGGLGNLGEDQLAWLAADLQGRSDSTPVVVFAHIPLWTVYPAWGWGTDDGARALSLLRRFGSVTVLNGHIHQILQKVEGNVTFHTARSTAFPQPAPGSAPSPGPMKVPADKLRTVLGVTSVAWRPNAGPLAVIDATLA
ncbi:MAG: metallophosphoesterase [Azospirillaceae bacterium]|nr:metallophosphoesterase [Azospirillaceae bacterium]